MLCKALHSAYLNSMFFHGQDKCIHLHPDDFLINAIQNHWAWTKRLKRNIAVNVHLMSCLSCLPESLLHPVSLVSHVFVPLLSVMSLLSRLSQVVKISHCLIDPELFSHTAYVKIFATLARKAVNWGYQQKATHKRISLFRHQQS